MKTLLTKITAIMLLTAVSASAALAWVPPIRTGEMKIQNDTQNTLAYTSNYPGNNGSLKPQKQADLRWATINGGVKVYIAGCTLKGTQPTGVVNGNGVICKVDNRSSYIQVAVVTV